MYSLLTGAIYNHGVTSFLRGGRRPPRDAPPSPDNVAPRQSTPASTTCAHLPRRVTAASYSAPAADSGARAFSPGALASSATSSADWNREV